MIDDRMYDVLKTIALLITPLTVLISSLLETWGVPFGAQITSTFAAIDVFLGTMVTILKSRYDNENDDDDDNGMVG